MYGYDLSSRSRMLKRGWYCLMKFCSVSSASASVATRMNSMRLDRVDHLVRAARSPGSRSADATRFLIDFALPT